MAIEEEKEGKDDKKESTSKPTDASTISFRIQSNSRYQHPRRIHFAQGITLTVVASSESDSTYSDRELRPIFRWGASHMKSLFQPEGIFFAGKVITGQLYEG